jgi:AbrB family looped-hinge helix DNA binding protein
MLLKIKRCSEKGRKIPWRIFNIGNVKVMSKGQITILKEIRSKLGLSTGDSVTWVCDEDQVTMINSSVYAMKRLQKGLEGQANMVGLDTEEAIDALVEVEGL